MSVLDKDEIVSGACLCMLVSVAYLEFGIGGVTASKILLLRRTIKCAAEFLSTEAAQVWDLTRAVDRLLKGLGKEINAFPLFLMNSSHLLYVALTIMWRFLFCNSPAVCPIYLI